MPVPWKIASFWKDQLALTWHLRTFIGSAAASKALVETAGKRGLDVLLKLEGAVFLPATPTMQFIDCDLTYKTTSPVASCHGRIILWPVRTGETLSWKIWVLGTWLADLDAQPEDESLLTKPGREDLSGAEPFETDVLIIGGGNAAVILSARLKAINVNCVMIERHARPGDNWKTRYDSLKFHVPTSFCTMPFLPYEEHLAAPHLLTKDDLGNQVARFASTFHLNMLTSSTVKSTQCSPSKKRWTVTIQTPHGLRTARAKHLVQATGISSQIPYTPSLPNAQLYTGTSIHSSLFKNGQTLKSQGISSVLVVGSANTAFDVMADCHAAGLQVTMAVRSPTYVCPVEYVLHPGSLGMYDGGVAQADRAMLTVPSIVDAQLARGLLRAFGTAEPDRYKALREAGFPALDSADPDVALFSNLVELGGKHYMDTGVTSLIAEGKAAVKVGEPVAWCAEGLEFNDGSRVQADAVVWCTGYADRNVRDTAAAILGGGRGEVEAGAEEEGEGDVLGPEDIAARLDETWGVDAEGEIRGMWKRHAGVDNYWVMGGYTQQHRWHSKNLALQIKAALEGLLPEAYRDIPTA